MDANKIKMGKLSPSWEEGTSQNITFCVTEDCNLRCKYCYMIGKNTRNRMSYETAVKAVNFALSDEPYLQGKDSVVWEFIGGEPFLEIDLIDKLCDYIKKEMYIRKHRWFNSYRFSFSTNGLTYDTPKVQKYIQKNKEHLSIGISVDGNKIKHDAQRVKVDGSGSFEDVKNVVPLWVKQFPGASTKATFAHDDLIHLKDSIIALWNMGITEVAANVVFEDVWTEGDDKIFENQLIELADYIIENELWNDYTVRFFDPDIGFPLIEEEKGVNYCGAGHMIAVDYKGDIYPCIRYTPFTLSNAEGYKIGNIESGINYDLIRPFENLTLKVQSKDECVNCEVATGCSWCSGYNYDECNGETIFHRAIHNCLMHKANIRAIEYFWDKLSSKLNIENPRIETRRKREIASHDGKSARFMQIITSDNITPHCCYRNAKGKNNIMAEETFNKALAFCDNKGFEPVILGDGFYNKDTSLLYIGTNESDDIVIHDNVVNSNVSENNILLVSKSNIGNLFDMVCKLLDNEETLRINIILMDLDEWNESNMQDYKNQLELISEKLYESYLISKPVDINVLTDIFQNTEINDCGSGVNSFAVAPNGKIYICPAFYFNDIDDSIGDLENGISIEREDLLHAESSITCSNCDAYHCKRCLYLNKKMTKEISTSPKIQCLISHAERSVSRELELRLIRKNLLDPLNYIKKIEYDDPLDKIKSAKQNREKLILK